MSNIRKYIIPTEDDGVLLELDFSQLEIVVLAHLSGDEALKHDLLSGVDLHNVSATSLFGAGFTKDQRRIAKQFSFQLQYGAGYKSMAASSNMPEEVAKKFIEQYYKRYPGVKAYQALLQEKIDVSRKKSHKRTPDGLPAGQSKFQSETARIYTFTESDAPEWMRESKWGRAAKSTTFSPTKVKNYQVQGYATGDIVPVVLGALWRTMLAFNRSRGARVVNLINTVHDSVLFDCASYSVGEEWARIAKTVMESAPKLVHERLGVEFSMPLKVEAEIGKDWFNMKELKL